MARNFRLIYDVKDFKTYEAADAHFAAHWERDNPEVAERIATSDVSSVKDLFAGGGAHYWNGRWNLIRDLQIINYTKLEPGASTPGAENVLTKCPQCGRTVHHYPLGVTAGTVYLHLSSIQDGKKVELARHIVFDRPDAMIDASDIRF